MIKALKTESGYTLIFHHYEDGGAELICVLDNGSEKDNHLVVTTPTKYFDALEDLLLEHLYLKKQALHDYSSKTAAYHDLLK